MTADEIKKIMEKRERLRREIEKIDTFLKLYRDLTGIHPEHSEPSTGNAVTHDTDELRSRGRKRQPATVSPADIIPMVRRVLLEQERPMTRSELLDELENRDVRLAGKDKARYLGTILRRAREEFVNIDNVGYWPKDVPYLRTGYIPRTRRFVDGDFDLKVGSDTEESN